jgi:site-specific recombinase XerD
MIAEQYLGRSQLYRRLKNGSHGPLIERYAARLVEEGFCPQVVLRCLSLVGGLLSWIARRRSRLTDLDELMVDRYLRNRARKRSIALSDRPALRRFLLVLRDAGTIAPAEPPRVAPQNQIFAAFGDYLERERGSAPRTITEHLPKIRRFLSEVCPAGADDLGSISQADVVHYVERHARDWSPKSGKKMCSSLRAFLRYLHHKGLNPVSLAGCVPSIREWKLASLPTYLSAEQVQNVLDGCDRTSGAGRRDYAILMMLAKLGLRADEVATLALDDIDWRSGVMCIRAKGRQRARMPIPADVGAAIVDYLRDGRPKASCRRLFLRTRAPRIGFSSSDVISKIAKTALARVGVRGFARQGAHLFRHSLATELLRSGATLSEIGQLLRHKNHDTTRIYAKVDIDTLRTLSLPWPGGAQ